MSKKKYTSFKNALQFYKPQDVLQHATHLTAAAGVMAAVGWWVGPLTFAGCALAAGGCAIAGGKLGGYLLKIAFTEREIKDSKDKGISANIKAFTKAAGLRAAPVLKDLSLNVDELEKKSEEGYQPPQVRRALNAAVGGNKEKYLLVSQELIDALDSEQTKSVIGHEFAHLGAGHLAMSKITGWMQTTTTFAGLFALGAAVVSTGWLLGAAAVATSLGVFFASKKLMPSPKDSYTRDGELKPKAKAVELGGMAVEEVLSVGILASVNPVPVLTAYAVEQGSYWSSLLINRSYSRRCEFQADREAVRLGANPLDLIASLRTIEKSLEIDEPELSGAMNWRKGPLYARFIKAAGSVVKTHPDTTRRCRRLAKQAKQMGVEQGQIDAAMNSPIDETLLRNAPDVSEEFKDATLSDGLDDQRLANAKEKLLHKTEDPDSAIISSQRELRKRAQQLHYAKKMKKGELKRRDQHFLADNDQFNP